MITYRGQRYLLLRLWWIMQPLAYCNAGKPCAQCFESNAWSRR